MNIYHLYRHPGSDIDWDETCAVVVRAFDEQHARQLASGVAGDEGADAWLTDAETACVELVAHVGDEGVICRDFNAG